MGSITPMEGFCGGCNEGLWFVENDTRETLVLKLVRSKRTGAFASFPSEVEKFMGIYEKFPSIVTDSQLAFPIKMFNCVGQTGHSHDVIAMSKVRGERLSDWVGSKWFAGKEEEVYTVFKRLGSFLAQFHKDYSAYQHGD